MPWIIGTILTVFVPLALIYVHVCRRVIASLTLLTKWSASRVRWIVIGCSIYLNLFPVLFLLAFLILGQTRIGTFAGENFVVDVLFVYPFWFGLVIMVHAFLAILLIDAVALIVRWLGTLSIETRLRSQSYVVITVLAVITMYSVAVIARDTWTVRVTERSLKLPPPAAELGGLTLVLISDVQGDGRTNAHILRDYVERVNGLKGDIVLFAGDLVTSGEDYIENTARIMGMIKAPLGKYAAVGDHDIFSNKERVTENLRNNGFVIADDTTISVSVKGIPVSISLVTQTYRQHVKIEALNALAADAGGALKIFLVHQPSEALVWFARDHGYDLFAAGHTHGGGVSIGVPGIYTFAPANLETRFVSGFYQVGTMVVAVTNGLGMTLAPIRFQAPAEITVLRLAS